MKLSFFKKKPPARDAVLERGWQFFANPTNLEPPGTVFRIDGEGRRFLVERLPLEVESGPEVAGRVELVLETKASILARLLGLQPLEATARAAQSRRITFEATDLLRETTLEAGLPDILAPFLAALDYRADNRYFLLRETRSASAMTLELSEGLVGELGGEAGLGAALAAGATLSAGKQGHCRLVAQFPERLRIMFLPDEIKPVSAGLAEAEPELGLVPVTAPLSWRDAD